MIEEVERPINKIMDRGHEGGVEVRPEMKA